MSLAQLKNKYSLFAVICMSIFFIIIVVLQKKWSHEQVIIWDTVYYYAYLPATFIEHDYRMRFVDKDLKNYEDLSLTVIDLQRAIAQLVRALH